MKKAIIAAITLAAILFLWVIYIVTRDEAMQWAKHHLPLGTRYIYTIEINEPVYQVDGSSNPAGGYVYTILKDEDEVHQQLAVPGRLIGSSSVDLAAFIDQRVTISGHFYKGTPLLLQTDNVPDEFTEERVVLHVESVTPVATTTSQQ